MKDKCFPIAKKKNYCMYKQVDILLKPIHKWFPTFYHLNFFGAIVQLAFQQLQTSFKFSQVVIV